MTLNTLQNLEVPLSILKERASSSRWPLIPHNARPPTSFVLDQVDLPFIAKELRRKLTSHTLQVRPLVLDFQQRHEAEWRWLPGLEQVLEDVEKDLGRLEGVVEAGETSEGKDEAGLTSGNST